MPEPSSPPTAPRSSLLDALRAERDSDLSRVIGLSDGIFGFALTLLVINLVLPAPPNGALTYGTTEELRHALTQTEFPYAFLAYVVSFGIIAVSWTAHRRVFAHIRTADGWLIRFNLMFLFFVAATPFFAELLSRAGGIPLAVQLYALDQVGVGGALAAVWHRALRRGHVAPDADPLWKRFLTVTLTVRPLLFAASIGIANVNLTLAYVTWTVALVVQVVTRRTPSPPAPAGPANPLPP